MVYVHQAPKYGGVFRVFFISWSKYGRLLSARDNVLRQSTVLGFMSLKENSRIILWCNQTFHTNSKSYHQFFVKIRFDCSGSVYRVLGAVCCRRFWNLGFHVLQTPYLGYQCKFVGCIGACPTVWEKHRRYSIRECLGRGVCPSNTQSQENAGCRTQLGPKYLTDPSSTYCPATCKV